MNRFRKENRKHIEEIFSVKTGVALHEKYHPVGKAAVILAAAIVCFTVFAGFSADLFSGLSGDELSLSASYQGEGIVTIQVENRSEKNLTFQKDVKLMRWSTGEEIAPVSGRADVENREFPAHTQGTMTIDLSKAYDLDALEAAMPAKDWYYFVLTNNGFLFGHDWQCPITFGQRLSEKPVPEQLSPAEADAVLTGQIPEKLMPFFQTENRDEARRQEGEYYEAVEKILASVEGNLVKPAAPSLGIDGMNPETPFDDTVPLDKQHWLCGLNWHLLDDYGIPVGATMEDHALTVTALAPIRKGEDDGGYGVNTVYYMFYPAADIQSPEDLAFIRGRLLTFREMEDWKIYEDDDYVGYDVTDLFYSDLRTHTENILLPQGAYFDEQIWQRIQNITAFYRDPETVQSRMYYLFPES